MMYVEHKQVLVGKLTQMAASQAPLQLLQGVAKIDEEFDSKHPWWRTSGTGAAADHADAPQVDRT